MREQIGHYQILKKLGAGGMGEVYLAQDTRLGRRAALKILPDNVASDNDRMSRFTREAKAASALNHPNVATIYDVGNANGTRFIAMEYVEGRTLAARIADSALAANEIIEIALQLADALDAAHATGITHRDIKPANVMVTPRGQIKVLDFGLAKISGPDAATGDSQLPTFDGTMPGLVMGTVDYMSPEQVLGHEVDHRSDIFSLGVVLYEMAARRRPFSGTTPTETMDRVLNAPYESIGADTKFPVELDRIVRKCLEKDRERRYQTARDVLVDLKNLQRDGNSKLSARPRSLSSKAIPAVVAVAVLVVAVVLGFAWWSSLNQSIESVAVMPFSNEGGKPETEYLADGITESVISNLSQLSRLSVQSRSSVFRFKGLKIDPQLAGQEMNVQAVVVGRVVPRDDRVAISWELIDVGDGHQIAGDQFERKLDDLLLVQTDIAREVSTNLQPRLSEAERQNIAKPPTENPEAYQLYLKGRFASSQVTEEGFNEAIKYFTAALDRDPKYALALVGLADSYIGLGTDYMSPIEAMPRAKSYVEQALRLNDNLAEAHSSLGIIRLIYDWDWPAAEREFKNNLSLSPQTVETFTCSLHYADPMGRNEEAIKGIRRALKVDPYSMSTNLELGCASYYGHHYEQAIIQSKKALTMYPGHAGLTFGLARALTQTGMYKEAIDALSAAKTSSGNWPPIVAELGYANGRTGNEAEARKTLHELEEQSVRRYVDPYLLAVIHFSLGDKEQTFAWLDKAYDQRSGWLPWLTLEPKWTDLHSDKRFTELARRVGLARVK